MFQNKIRIYCVKVSVKVLCQTFLAHKNTSQLPNMAPRDLIKEGIQQTATSNHNHLHIVHISSAEQTPKPLANLPHHPK